MPTLFRTGIRTPEQSTPSTPAAGFRLLYAKSTGLYDLGSDAVERLLSFSSVVIPFSVTGALTTRVGPHRIYVESSFVFESARASVGTAPTGASLIMDINKNGTTIYTTQSARPTVTAGTNTATANSPAVTSFSSGDYLSVDIDQIGSTVAGSDLTVAVWLRKV